MRLINSNRCDLHSLPLCSKNQVVRTTSLRRIALSTNQLNQLGQTPKAMFNSLV